MRRAFTLIELIVTMVVLSIVAYISTDLVLGTYKSYNQVNSISKANLKLEIALNSIANRLQYSIVNTVVKRKSESDYSIAPINSAPPEYKVLEWIGYDIDSFVASDIGDIRPAWSGFCDIKNSTSEEIKTSGSNLYFADDIIKRVSNKGASLSDDSVALFFAQNYEFYDVGYISPTTTFQPDKIGVITSYSGDSLKLKTPIFRATQKYKLSWSAYAILPINCSDRGCDLVLRYNFRPWAGSDYFSSDALANSKLLATNVTVFKTYATANRVHIKICIKEEFMHNKFSSICKEKVIFR